jgi:hypothetical protein
MISLLFFLLFFILELSFFLSTIKRIGSVSHFIPDKKEYKFQHFLVPLLDLETIPATYLLETISSYREILDKKYPFTDLSNEEIAKNYKIITCITLSSDSKSNLFFFVLRTLNTLLIQRRENLNDFSVFKSLIEKSITDMYDNISGMVYLPLLLGGLGAILSISLGFFEMSLQSQEISALRSTFLVDFFKNISIGFLIFGLGMTLSILNMGISFPKAKQTLQVHLSVFYQFLQKEIHSVSTNEIADGISTLPGDLIRFNQEFAKSVQVLNTSIHKNHQTLLSQEKTLAILEKINPEKIALAGITFFEELNKNSESFLLLAGQFSKLNSFIEITNKLFAVAESTLNRFSRFEGNIEKISQTIHLRLEESGKLLDFLGSHLSTLENRREDMQSIIISTDSILKESYKELTNSEREILFQFKESSLRSAEEYKKILQDFTRQSKEISLNLLDTLKTLENSVSDLSENRSPREIPEQPVLQKSPEDNSALLIKQIASDLESILKQMEERAITRENLFMDSLQKVASIPSQTLTFPEYPEQEFQKLMTQLNLNQIYMENVLKEVLKELRGESTKNKELTYVSVSQALADKVKKLF